MTLWLGRAKPNYSSVKVVGINETNLHKISDRWKSERLDEGYLYNRSLKSIDDYYFTTSKGRIRIYKDTQYANLKCRNLSAAREYTIFELVINNEVKSYIGIYAGETDFFKTTTSTNLSRVFSLNQIESLALFNENSFQEDNSEPLPYNDEYSRFEHITGSFGDVICTSASRVNVRKDNIQEIAFKAVKGERVKIFQGFNGSFEKQETINGREYKFTKVEFVDREEQDQNAGWVASILLAPAANCSHINVFQNIISRDTEISGLEDPKCCEFPLVRKVKADFTTGMRAFNANRSRGNRTHAACDLYRPKYEPVLSVAPGTVLNGFYYFYQGTYALEIFHSGGFIVRYGEIMGNVPKELFSGVTVKMGQKIGTVGQVNSNCFEPMLHFELFSGEETGSLSKNGNEYQRRKDLLDPTEYLLHWEKQNGLST